MRWRLFLRLVAKTSPTTKLERLGAFTSALVATLCLMVTATIAVEGLKGNWTLPGLLATMFCVAIFVPLQIVSLLHGAAAVFPQVLKNRRSATLSIIEEAQIDKLRFFYRSIGFLTLIGVGAAAIAIAQR